MSDEPVRHISRPCPFALSSYACTQSPLPLRIALARAFIRDLTFLARLSSSLVLTESSNVGRLFTLLAGREMVDAGKVISADVRWFPKAYYD
ncbi:hypothetical protein JCM6882_007545 [Rhodosporidiobolus microsporus]